MKKPRIIRTSNSEDVFDWVSDGWCTAKNPNWKLFKKAKDIIQSGKTVKDVVKNLREAGFVVSKILAKEGDVVEGTIRVHLNTTGNMHIS